MGLLLLNKSWSEPAKNYSKELPTATRHINIS